MRHIKKPHKNLKETHVSHQLYTEALWYWLHSTFPIPVRQPKRWPGCFTCVSMFSTDGETYGSSAKSEASAIQGSEKSYPSHKFTPRSSEIPPSSRFASETASTSGQEIQFWAKTSCWKETRYSLGLKNEMHVLPNQHEWVRWGSKGQVELYW